MNLKPSVKPALLLCLLSSLLPARVPAADRLPPAGLAIPDVDRQELTEAAASLAKEIESLQKDLKSKPKLLALLPDVVVFHKAVDWALRYDEFFDTRQPAFARKLLNQGNE